jgi:hypothetical protein
MGAGAGTSAGLKTSTLLTDETVRTNQPAMKTANAMAMTNPMIKCREIPGGCPFRGLFFAIIDFDATLADLSITIFVVFRNSVARALGVATAGKTKIVTLYCRDHPLACIQSASNSARFCSAATASFRPRKSVSMLRIGIQHYHDAGHYRDPGPSFHRPAEPRWSRNQRHRPPPPKHRS